MKLNLIYEEHFVHSTIYNILYSGKFPRGKIFGYFGYSNYFLSELILSMPIIIKG